MAFTGRSRETIRASILSNWSAEYAARGYALYTARNSPAWLDAGAFAVELEGVEAQAEQTQRDILPDQASEEALGRHGYVNDVDRRTGVRARLTVTVTSSVAGTYNITPGTLMVFNDGTVYAVDSQEVITSGGSPSGSIEVTASEEGTSGTRDAGASLTFVAAPAGLDSTGTVASVIREGEDEETVAQWAARIILQLRDRPAAGNRADWRDWMLAYTATEIEDAYVYPLLAAPASLPGAGTPNTPGSLTVLPIGPAQGDSVTNTRIVPSDNASSRAGGADLPFIRGYIEGYYDTEGALLTGGSPKRPASLPAGNYSIEQITESSAEDIVVDIEVTSANLPSWSGTMTVVSATSSTLVVSGDQTANANKNALVNIGTGNYRGGYKLFALGAGVFGGVNTTFTVSGDTSIANAVATGAVYPAPGNWAAIRTAVLAYFDALGPGDTSPPSRWPSEDEQGRSTLYRTALAAAVLGASGVLSATTTTPAGDVTPAAKTVVKLGKFSVTC